MKVIGDTIGEALRLFVGLEGLLVAGFSLYDGDLEALDVTVFLEFEVVGHDFLASYVSAERGIIYRAS